MGDPSPPDFRGQTVGLGCVAGALEVAEESGKARVGLIGGSRARCQCQQQDGGPQQPCPSWMSCLCHTVDMVSRPGDPSPAVLFAGTDMSVRHVCLRR